MGVLLLFIIKLLAIVDLLLIYLLGRINLLFIVSRRPQGRGGRPHEGGPEGLLLLLLIMIIVIIMIIIILLLTIALITHESASN